MLPALTEGQGLPSGITMLALAIKGDATTPATADVRTKSRRDTFTSVSPLNYDITTLIESLYKNRQENFAFQLARLT